MSFYEDRIFPHLLDWATRPLERDRQQLLQEAKGRVLELGVGTGANLPFYPDQASQIHGIEPAEALLDKARTQASQLPSPERFQLIQAGAENLPYVNNYFDTAIACLVFCTIPEAERAATELARVMKPGSRLLLMEHVASEHRFTRSLQNGLTPLWRHAACGCHLNRDTGKLLNDYFDMDQVTRWRHPKLPAIAGELLSGMAVRKST